jgi:hypothetical protein
MSKWFRHPEDVTPVCCIVSLFLLDLLVYFFVQDVRLLTLWFALAVWPKMFICSWNHHHQHLFTFHQPILNRLLEIVYALHTGITTNAWVLHHVLGHHINYLDQTKDESTWKRRDGTMMGEIEYTLKTAATGYLRAFQVALRYPRQRAGFLGMGLVVLALLAAAFYHDWVNATFVFAMPMLVGYLITVWHTYAHHHRQPRLSHGPPREAEAALVEAARVPRLDRRPDPRAPLSGALFPDQPPAGRP